uniref:G protein-coupled receptor n=1 Tax=Panagrellus redivivus TaxID=6233 RepID=A0A7E4VS60_PANRE
MIAKTSLTYLVRHVTVPLSLCFESTLLMDSSAENSRIVSVYALGGLGFIFTVFQCQLIYVICVYRDFRSNLTYVIIAIGSVTELAQNVPHLYSALCLFFDSPFMFEASKTNAQQWNACLSDYTT